MTINEFKKFVFRNINLINCKEITFQEKELSFNAVLSYPDYYMAFNVLDKLNGIDFEISYYTYEDERFYYVTFEEKGDIDWNTLDKNKFENVFDNALEVVKGSDSGWDIEKVTGLTRATVSNFRKENSSLRASNVGTLIALSNYHCLKTIEIENK